MFHIKFLPFPLSIRKALEHSEHWKWNINSKPNNYESSNYTQGDGWSSFYHSGSFGSGYFYDDYDFTADWSESFNGVTNSYSSAHSASNDVEGYEYNLSGYFSDYYNTWTGQSPDSGSYSDSYPSSNSYASTVTENGFSFTWNGSQY